MRVWILLLLFSTSLSASPIDQMTKTGEGTMRYLFWTLYDAEFYRQSAHSDDDANTELGNDVALRLTYKRTISKAALIEATADQWQHLGYESGRIQQWLAPLDRIWPDVSAGDQLTLHIDQQGISRFYFNDKEIGLISNSDFGPAFLAIWLSENTSEPKLRKQLLGLTP